MQIKQFVFELRESYVKVLWAVQLYNKYLLTCITCDKYLLPCFPQLPCSRNKLNRNFVITQLRDKTQKHLSNFACIGDLNGIKLKAIDGTHEQGGIAKILVDFPSLYFTRCQKVGDTWRHRREDRKPEEEPLEFTLALKVPPLIFN